MRLVYPVVFYEDEGFIEYKYDLVDSDIHKILEDHVFMNSEYDLDEAEADNLRPLNTWFYVNCRKYINPELPIDEQIEDADEIRSGEYEERDQREYDLSDFLHLMHKKD